MAMDLVHILLGLWPDTLALGPTSTVRINREVWMSYTQTLLLEQFACKNLLAMNKQTKQMHVLAKHTQALCFTKLSKHDLKSLVPHGSTDVSHPSQHPMNQDGLHHVNHQCPVTFKPCSKIPCCASGNGENIGFT